MKGLSQSESMPIRRGMFIFLLLLVTVMFFGLIFSFLMACFWASIFAILFKGVFIWMTKKLNGRRSLASLLTTLIILLSAVIPIGLVSIAVVNESKHLYSAIEEGNIDPSAVLHRIEDQIPGIEEMLTSMGVDLDQVYARANESISEGITLIGKRM